MESTQKNITHGLLSRLVVIMAFLFAGAIGAFAAVGPYVVFDSDAKTMTFKYGEQPLIDNKQCFTLNSNTYVPNWSAKDDIKKNVTTVVFDKSFAAASPTTCRSWFNGFYQLTEIKGIKNLNTSNVSDMAYMFAGCSKLKSVDLTYMYSPYVKNMSYMFCDCSSLKTVYLKGLNTSNVEDMRSMFEFCTSLGYLDLSSFNTQKVKNFEKMFYGCSWLKAIYASPKFVVVNSPNLISTTDMFYRCSKLAGESKSYNIAHVNGDFAKIVGGYFLDATYLKPWVKQNGKTITFYYGYKKTFREREGEYELSSWLNKNKDNSKPFTKATFDESFALHQPDSCEYWFNDYTKLEEIENLHYLNTSKVTTMHNMFYRCTSLKSLDLSAFETSNVEDFGYMFWKCNRLESLDVSSFDTSAATNMKAMFTYCQKLKTIDLTNFETANVQNMEYMFSSCTNLKAVIVGSKFSSSQAYCGFMFKNTPAQLYSHIDDYLANTGNKTFPYGRSIKPYFPVNDKAEYGTLCSPVGGTLGDGTFIGFDKLYEVDADRTDKTAVKLKQVTKIEAGKPYIYHRDLTADTPVAAAVSFDATNAKASAPVNSGMMRGSFKSITAPGGSYILQTDGMFHRVASGNKSLKVGAYRAYLDMNKVGSEAKTVTMSFDDETTGITDVNAPATKSADTTIYDLSGRRISSPQRGQIYIFKGKKLLKVKK